MPQLARLRFVRVGHREARADDLTLSFLDDGRPTDTTLWLRNGGGKSSLLALFFSMMVPHKRQFLGKTDTALRELADYVAVGDTGVVTAEWILDRAQATLDLGLLTGPRLVTGTVLEWNDTRGDEGRTLDRQYFSCRTTPGVLASALEGLPLSTNGGRTTLKGLRQAWATLRQQAPDAEAFWTGAPGEWVEQLESLGLDPRLFAAQATMNQGEGEADRLFADLKTSDDYVRYFLTLLAPLELSEPILQNLEAHRKALHKRQTALLPEQDLVAGLRQRVAVLAEIQAERAGRAAAVVTGLAEAVALDAALSNRSAQADSNVDAAEAEADAQRTRAEGARQAARAAAREAAWCQLWQAQQAAAAAEHDRDEVNRENKLVTAAEKLWAAVHTLATVRRHEATAERLQAQLMTLEAEHRPLREDVQAAAVRLAGALEARRQRADQDRHAAVEALAGAAESFGLARAEETRAIGEARQAAHRADEARRRQRDAAEDLQRMSNHGLLDDAEAVADAAHRHQRAIETALVALAQTDQDRRTTEQRRHGARLAAHAAAERARSAAADLARHAQALAQATEEAEHLNADVQLARLLELDQTALDVRVLDAAAVARLRAAAAAAEDQHLARHVDAVTETRALQYLQTHGTLPPSPTVERLLRVLRNHLPQAWDGWGYLTETMTPQAARALVVRAPAVATGIVVRDPHFDAAIAALAGEIPDLDEPVLLVPSSAVTDDAPVVAGIVVGPGDDAHFSRQAGERALAVRAERHRVTERAKEEAASFRDAANTRALRLEEWQRRYPPSWWRATAEAHTAAETALVTARAEHAAQDAIIEGAEAALKEIAERRDVASQAETRARHAVEELRLWQQRHPDGLEGYEAQAQAADTAKTLAEAAATAARDQQQTAEEQRSDAERRRADAERGAEQSERDIHQIRLRPEGPIEPLPGDPVQLRQTHGELLRLYEERVGAHELTHQIATATDEATVHRETLRTQCGTVLAFSEVEAAFAELTDPAEALRRQAEAEARRVALWPRLGNLSSILNLRQGQLKQAEDAWAAAGGLELGGLPEPASDAEATQRVRTARAEEQRALFAATEADQVVATAVELALSERLKAERAREAQEALAPTLDGLRTLVRGLGQAESSPPDLGSLDDVGIRDRRHSLNRLYTREDTALRELDRRRDAGHQAVREWCDEELFVSLPDSVGPRLKRFTAAQLEGQASELMGELEHRARMIAEDLAATERDRLALIQQVRGTARDGAVLLTKLARSSMIPETVPNLGGHALLECRLRMPETEEEGIQRMGALLDDYVAKGELPGAVAFLQEAVLRLAGPVTLKVLRPTMDTMARYEPIGTLGKFSGGEKLTVATLLYCALATTRAQTVGRRREPTGTLLMDNPFGKASRASFITLQRQVAERLGIQLIYLTGINDLEAIRLFPTVVRLENARYDRRTGERVVEVGDPEETRALLSAVRISRRETSRKGAVSGADSRSGPDGGSGADPGGTGTAA